MLGHQGVISGLIFDKWQPLEQEAQIAIGFQAIGLGGFDQGVKGGSRMGTVGVTREQPVLPTYHEGADGVFSDIVMVK